MIKSKSLTNRNDTLSLSQLNGKPLTIIVKPEKEKQVPIIKCEDLVHMKTKYNLSSNVTKNIASSLRLATKNRNLIEPNLKEKLVSENHKVDNFFEVKVLNFTKIKCLQVSVKPETFVFCNNIDSFIKLIESKREVMNPHLKIGIDGGGDF